MSLYILHDDITFRKESFGGIAIHKSDYRMRFYNLTASMIISLLKHSSSYDELCDIIGYSEVEHDFSLQQFLDKLVADNILVYGKDKAVSEANFFFNDVDIFSSNHLFSPLGVEIEYTLKCSRNCTYCSYDSSPFVDVTGELSVDQWADVLLKLKNAGVLFVRFTGGDPYVRKDFHQVLKIADQLGFIISVGTDLTLFTENDAKFLSGLNNLSMVQTTLDGATPESNDLYRGRGNYNRVLEGMKMLNRHKIPFIVGTVLRKSNVEEIYDIGQLLRAYNADGYCFAPLYAAGRGNNLVNEVPNNEDLHYANKQYRRLLLEKIIPPADDNWQYIVDQLSEHDFRNMLNDQPYLTRIGDRLMRINPWGDCYISIKIKEHFGPEDTFSGNISRQSIQEVWNESQALSKIRSLSNKNEYFGEIADVRKLN